MMDHVRFRQCLDALHWGSRKAAEILAVQRSAIIRMGKGEYDVPPALADWLEGAAGYLLDHPHPEGWEYQSDAEEYEDEEL